MRRYAKAGAGSGVKTTFLFDTGAGIFAAATSIKVNVGDILSVEYTTVVKMRTDEEETGDGYCKNITIDAKGEGTLSLPGFLELEFSMVLRINCGGIRPFVMATAPPIPMALIGNEDGTNLKVTNLHVSAVGTRPAHVALYKKVELPDLEWSFKASGLVDIDLAVGGRSTISGLFAYQTTMLNGTLSTWSASVDCRLIVDAKSKETTYATIDASFSVKFPIESGQVVPITASGSLMLGAALSVNNLNISYGEYRVQAPTDEPSLTLGGEIDEINVVGVVITNVKFLLAAYSVDDVEGAFVGSMWSVSGFISGYVRFNFAAAELGRAPDNAYLHGSLHREVDHRHALIGSGGKKRLMMYAAVQRETRTALLGAADSEEGHAADGIGAKIAVSFDTRNGGHSPILCPTLKIFFSSNDVTLICSQASYFKS